jgi:protein-tyrosine phosphatase
VTDPTPSPAGFEGLWNFRDLGGLPVASGGRTVPGLVFRAGTLWFATMQDCNRLVDYAFDSAIDLRLPREEQVEDDWLAELLDLRYHHIPIAVADDPHRITLVHGGGAEHYLRLLEHNTARYVHALDVISEPDNHPLLFHCAAGLDRTGVLAALVLSCLDVEEEAVVADYVAGERGVTRIIESYRGHKLYGTAAEESADLKVDGDAMLGFLRELGGTAGVRAWALDNGFKDVHLERMRTALVEN